MAGFSERFPQIIIELDTITLDTIPNLFLHVHVGSKVAK